MPGARSKAFRIEIVLAGTQEDDLNSLGTILTGSAWKLIKVSTCREAARTIHHLPVPIVLCDLSLEDQPWQETLRKLLMARGGTCVILLSNAPDRALSSKVVQQGGFGLLTRPLDRERVFQSLFLAYSRYKLGSPMDTLAPTVEGKRVANDRHVSNAANSARSFGGGGGRFGGAALGGRRTEQTQH
jgi:AmiR/NasT family two-component response regulator